MALKKRKIFPSLGLGNSTGDNANAWEPRKVGDIGKITAGGDIDKNEISI